MEMVPNAEYTGRDVAATLGAERKLDSFTIEQRRAASALETLVSLIKLCRT